MAKRVFYFHYNKPASRQAGKPQLSVHFDKTCSIVDAVRCDVPVESKNNKRQPHCVMRGKCNGVMILPLKGGVRTAFIS